MKRVAMIAALAIGLSGCATTHRTEHADCAMKWADAYPGHPLCPDATDRGPTVASGPTPTFSPEDAAFLSDLREVWDFPFAWTEAVAVCAYPKGQTASALPDIVRLIDPSYTGGDEDLSIVMDATEFMEVAGRHFCPGR